MMEYYLAIKRDEVLIHATIKISESQVKEARPKRLHMYGSSDMKCPEQANPHRQKADEWLPGAGEGEMESNCLLGMGCSSGVMGKF